MVLRPNIKQQNKSIWCIVDIPNLLLEPWQTVMETIDMTSSKTMVTNQHGCYIL